MNILVSIQERLSRLMSIAQNNSTRQDAEEAKSDYIAMMADIDLSDIEEDEEMEGMDNE